MSGAGWLGGWKIDSLLISSSQLRNDVCDATFCVLCKGGRSIAGLFAVFEIPFRGTLMKRRVFRYSNSESFRRLSCFNLGEYSWRGNAMYHVYLPSHQQRTSFDEYSVHRPVVIFPNGPDGIGLRQIAD